MLRYLYSLLLLGAALAGNLHAAAAPADENAAIEAAMKRLRDTLRTTMTQLQTAQAEVATLQAAKVEADDKILAQTARIEILTKQLATEQSNAKAAATEADAQLAGRSQELARTSEALEKWKNGYKQAASVANATEAKRSQLASKVVMLDRKVAEQRTRNADLYKLGMEILKRYEKFGLGSALLAREPFTGIAKVKFETLVQDYNDQLNDKVIKPDGNTSAATEVTAGKTETKPAESQVAAAKPESGKDKAVPAPAPKGAPPHAPMPESKTAAPSKKTKS